MSHSLCLLSSISVYTWIWIHAFIQQPCQCLLCGTRGCNNDYNTVPGHHSPLWNKDLEANNCGTVTGITEVCRKHLGNTKEPHSILGLVGRQRLPTEGGRVTEAESQRVNRSSGQGERGRLGRRNTVPKQGIANFSCKGQRVNNLTL